MDANNSSVGLAGLAGHLRGLGASLCEHASLRAELAATEYQAEKQLLVSLALGIVGFCVLVTTTLLFAALCLLALAWDSPQRMHVAFSLLAVFVLGSGLLGLWLKVKLDQEHRPFSKTVEELRRDAAVLRSVQS